MVMKMNSNNVEQMYTLYKKNNTNFFLIFNFQTQRHSSFILSALLEFAD